MTMAQSDFERKYRKYKMKYYHERTKANSNPKDINKFIKYKSTYESLYGTKKIKRGFSPANKPIAPPDKLIELFEKNKLHDVDILEIGIGNPNNGSIEISNRFAKTYTGLEPDRYFYELGLGICKELKCKIKLINTSLENFVSKDKFDVILFKNSIHFMNIAEIIGIIKKIMKPNGHIVISHPKKSSDNPIKQRKGYTFSPQAIHELDDAIVKTKNIILGGMYGHYDITYQRESVNSLFVVMANKSK